MKMVILVMVMIVFSWYLTPIPCQSRQPSQPPVPSSYLGRIIYPSMGTKDVNIDSRVPLKNFFLIFHFFLDQSCQIVWVYRKKCVKFEDP